MSRWFLDAGVLLAAQDAEDANHADARRLLDELGSLAMLDLALYEVTNMASPAPYAGNGSCSRLPMM
jgi:predicted nucleic acid-binding protein